MQKNAGCCGGKGRGTNGAPTPAANTSYAGAKWRDEISHLVCLQPLLIPASDAPGMLQPNAATDARWWWCGVQEMLKAMMQGQEVTSRDGRNATCVSSSVLAGAF